MEAKDQYTPDNSSYGLHYAFERTKASYFLKSGAIFGNLSLPQEYKIPFDILESRFSKSFDKYDLDPIQWSTITISGPPGSGKTELANVLSSKLISEYKMIILVLSTPKQLAKIEEISKRKYKDGLEELVDDQLIKNIAKRYDSNFELSEMERAMKDALYKKIKDENCPITILVDDLHSRRSVRDSLFRLCSKRWGVNFILIGRTRFTDYEGFPENKDIIHIACQLWNKDQSKKMMLSWLPESKRFSEIRFLEEWWPSNLKNCSLYLLREIINSPEQVTSKPSALLKTAIKHHISSMEEIIGPHKKSASMILEEIRNLLYEKASPEEILQRLNQESETTVNIILLLGLLSWYSRYELQSNTLNPQKIVTWSKGIISSNNEAYEFLRKGEEAKIFSLFGMEAEWRNKLVAEACAALYLNYEVDRHQSNSTIANMIELLDHAGSIEILNLALDIDQMKKIVASVSSAKCSSAFVVDKLLNEEFILKVNEDKKWIEKLGFALIEQGNRVDACQIEPFARSFSRLMLLSSKEINRLNNADIALESWCLEHITSGDIGKSKFSLAALAAYHQNDSEYFEKVKDYNADPFISIEMAARLWSEESENILCEKLLEFSENIHENDKIQYIWSCWCSRQDNKRLIDIVRHLILMSNKFPEHENYYVLLVSSSLNILFQDRSKISLEGIEEIKLEVSRIAKNRKRTMASELAKWVFFYYFPNLSDLTLKWIVDSEGNYALPLTPYHPLKLREIFSKIASVYPLVDLPSSKEICIFENHYEGKVELVRDNFLKGYIQGETKIIPEAISTWDGSKVGYLTKEEIESKAVLWRPLYRLDR